MKVLPRGTIARADRLRSDTLTASVKARRKDSRVIEHKNIAGMQKFGQVEKLAVTKLAIFPVKMEHAGAITVGQRFLRNEFSRKMEVEV